MNKLSIQKRAQVLGLLVEGNSLRAASRLADCSVNTVTKLLVNVGAACSEYQDKTLRNLPCKRVQVDEIWAFVYAKERSVLRAKQAPTTAGDIWTWTAICADTKLVPSWLVGDRSGATAKRFICDLSGRLTNRIQLTSDGHKVYVNAVEEGFGAAIDYAQLVKVYGQVFECRLALHVVQLRACTQDTTHHARDGRWGTGHWKKWRPWQHSSVFS